MKRTMITDANGTKYIGVDFRRRRINRIAAISAGIIALPFFAAAFVGVGMAINNSPTPNDLRILANASAKNGIPCALEGHEVICPTKESIACKGIPNNDMKYCISLASRNAVTRKYQGAITHSPNGVELVKECRSQYKGQELTDCLHYSN